MLRRQAWIVLWLALGPAPSPGQAIITTVAGGGTCCGPVDGSPALGANIGAIADIAIDGGGNLYIAAGGRVVKVDTNGILTTVAGNGQLPPIDGSGDGGPATSTGIIPAGVAVDAAGNLYISDAGNRVRKVDTNGIITTIAGGRTNFSLGDGGPATSAMLNMPKGLAFDSAGNLYIADNANSRVRKVDTNGIIMTVAGIGLASPGQSLGDGGPATSAVIGPGGGVMAITVDSAGDFYFAQSGLDASFMGFSSVREVDTNGIINTVAGGMPLGAVNFSGDGGPAASATLNNPRGLAVDSAGNLYISDSGNFRIRMVDGNGVITTIAGTGNNGHGGDGAAATAATFSPSALAMDPAGNLYVADSDRVRKISFSGQ